jgi:hypothetical protein
LKNADRHDFQKFGEGALTGEIQKIKRDFLIYMEAISNFGSYKLGHERSVINCLT